MEIKITDEGEVRMALNGIGIQEAPEKQVSSNGDVIRIEDL